MSKKPPLKGTATHPEVTAPGQTLPSSWSDSLSSPCGSPWPAGSPSGQNKGHTRRDKVSVCAGRGCGRFTDVDELHQDRLQVAEGGSGLHAETQLLLEVPAEGNLKRRVRQEGEDKITSSTV